MPARALSSAPARCGRGGGAARGVEHFARLGLCQRDQLRQGLHAGRGMHDQHHRRDGGERDRREVLGEVERQVGRDGGIDHVGHGAEEQRVAVLGGARGGFGGDAAARSRPVLDDELLAEGLAQTRADRAREKIARCPGRKAHDDAHRPRRIVVGASVRGHAHQTERRGHGGKPTRSPRRSARSLAPAAAQGRRPNAATRLLPAQACRRCRAACRPVPEAPSTRPRRSLAGPPRPWSARRAPLRAARAAWSRAP